MKLSVLAISVTFLMCSSSFAQTAFDRFERTKHQKQLRLQKQIGYRLIQFSKMLGEAENQIGAEVVAERFIDTLGSRIDAEIQQEIAGINATPLESVSEIIETAQNNADKSGNRDAIRAIREIKKDSRFAGDPRSQAVEILRSIKKDDLTNNFEGFISTHGGRVSEVFARMGRRASRDEVGIFDAFGLSRSLWAWARKEFKSFNGEAGAIFGTLFGTPLTLTFDVCAFPFILASYIYLGIEDIFTTTDDEKQLAEAKENWANERRELISRIRELEELKGVPSSERDGEAGRYRK